MVRKIYASRSEQNRAQYCRTKNIPHVITDDGYVVRTDSNDSNNRRLSANVQAGKSGKILSGSTRRMGQQDIIAEETVSPDLKDTVGWKIERWMKQFQPGDILLKHQLENQKAMDTYDMGTIRDPRQHGKTNYVLKPRILRRLCETTFTGPKSLIYGSHSYGNAINMTMILKYNLIQNPAILKNYGMLIDYTTYKQSRLQKQTQHIINLIGQRKTSHSFQGISTGQGIRGTSGIDECYIDDPIDLEKEEEYEKATKKFMGWYRFKIMPFCRGGKTWLIGTRYGIKDLWTILDTERIYYKIERASLLHDITTFKINWPAEGPLRANMIVLEDVCDWQLMAPELWSMQTYSYNGTRAQNIAFEIVKLGNRAAQQELMNNPLPINPLIRFEWFQSYDYLPIEANDLTWAIGMDIASGESEKADYTAIVLIGMFQGKYYLHDLIYGRWTSAEKVEKLKQFVAEQEETLQVDYRHIHILVETVMNQRDTFQRVRDETILNPRPISPSSRGKKKSKGDTYARINNGLAVEMENRKVYLHTNCRNKQQLKIEVDGFPKISDDHIIDISDQIIYYLKKKAYDLPTSGKTTSQFEPERTNYGQ